jgi:hypothetical protein
MLSIKFKVETDEDVLKIVYVEGTDGCDCENVS